MYMLRPSSGSHRASYKNCNLREQWRYVCESLKVGDSAMLGTVVITRLPKLLFFFSFTQLQDFVK